MSQGHINSLKHEIQVAEGTELSWKSVWEIERHIMSAIQYENDSLYKDKQYWMNQYLGIIFPDKGDDVRDYHIELSFMDRKFEKVKVRAKNSRIAIMVAMQSANGSEVIGTKVTYIGQ